MKYLPNKYSCIFLTCWIICFLCNCAKGNSNQLKQQIVRTDDQYISNTHLFFDMGKTSCEIKSPKKTDFNELIEKWTKIQSILSSLGHTHDSLETLLGLPVLQGKNWIAYVDITKVINDMQSDYMGQTEEALKASISEYGRIVKIIHPQYLNVYKMALDKRREYIKKLGFTTSL